MLSPGDRLVPSSREVTGEVIDGEAIIIDLTSGVYYSMTGAGGLLWVLVEAGQSLGEAAAEIAARYEAPLEQVRQDVERVAAELLEHGLCVRADASPPARPVPLPTPAVRLAYEAPRLHVYRDLSALLALDPPAPGLRDIPWKASATDPG